LGVSQDSDICAFFTKILSIFFCKKIRFNFNFFWRFDGFHANIVESEIARSDVLVDRCHEGDVHYGSGIEESHSIVIEFSSSSGSGDFNVGGIDQSGWHGEPSISIDSVSDKVDRFLCFLACFIQWHVSFLGRSPIRSSDE